MPKMAIYKVAFWTNLYRKEWKYKSRKEIDDLSKTDLTNNKRKGKKYNSTFT